MSENEQNRQMKRACYAVLATRTTRQPKPTRKRRRTSKAQREREAVQRVHTTLVYINGFPHHKDFDGTVTPI